MSNTETRKELRKRKRWLRRTTGVKTPNAKRTNTNRWKELKHDQNTQPS